MPLETVQVIDHQHEFKKAAFLPLAIAFFGVGIYAVYYAYGEIMKTYRPNHSVDYNNFLERLTDDFINRGFLILLFLLSIILLVVSWVRKNSMKTMISKGARTLDTDTGIVLEKYTVESIYQRFSKTWTEIEDREKVLTDLSKAKYYIDYDNPYDKEKNEQLRELRKTMRIDTSTGSSSGVGNVSMPIFDTGISSTGVLTVTPSSGNGGGGFSAMIILIMKNNTAEVHRYKYKPILKAAQIYFPEEKEED